MGILDDAIRQHLDLKRHHGAEDSEVKRLEDEAFGLPTRPGEPDFPESQEHAAVATEQRDEAEEPKPEVSAEAATTLLDPESAAPPAETPPEQAPPQAPAPAEEAPEPEPEPPAMEHPTVDDGPAEPSDEPAAEAPPAEPEAQPAAEPPAPEAAAPPAEEPSQAFDPPSEEASAFFDQAAAELDLDDLDLDLEDEDEEIAELVDEAELEEGAGSPDAEAPPSEEHPVAGLETEEHPIEELLDEEALIDPPPTEEETAAEVPATGEQVPESPPEPEPADEGEAEGDGDEGDVLEETPEFLRDQPEDEELWFEQGEPKDFDFD